MWESLHAYPEGSAGVRDRDPADGNRMGVDSCAPVGPTAASGPGFHVRWPPSGPRVSARAIPVSAGGRGPPADAKVPPVAMDFFLKNSGFSYLYGSVSYLFGYENIGCFSLMHAASSHHPAISRCRGRGTS